MVEKIYNLVEILDRDVVKNGDGVTPFQFKLSYSDGKTVDLKDKRVYVSFASTTTYLFKKKAEVDSEGTISITLNDADPIIEGNTEIEISVESSNGKSQKFPSQDGEHSAFVYISKSIESLNSRLINTYTLKQFSDKIDILMDDLNQKYDTHFNNLKKDVGDYIDHSVEDSVDEIKAVAKESIDASIKARKDSIAASSFATKEVKNTATKANTDINKVAADAKNSVTVTADTATKDIANTATKATIDITKSVSDEQKKITDTSNTAVATVTSKAKEVTDAITNNKVVKITDVVNYQKQKVTEDDGASLTLSQYDLLNTEDIKNFDGYVTSAPNAPTSVSSGFFKRKIRTGYIEVFFSPYNANAVYRNAYHFGNKTWYGWEKMAYQSESATTQKQKITNDDGAAKVYLTGSAVDVYSELLKLDKGFYSTYIASNTINSANSAVRGSIFVQEKGKWLSVFCVGSDNKIYSLFFDSASWSGWNVAATSTDVEALKITDTGWIPFTSLNGVKQNLQFKGADDNGFDCAYRVVTQQGVTTKHLRVNVENIAASGTVLAKLPAGFIKNAQPFSPRLPRNKMAATVVPRANGDIIAITPDNWIASDYLYGSFSWTD